MLKPDFSFCHTVMLERWLGRKISAETYAKPETMRCRVNLARKKTYLRSGQAAQEVIAEGTIFMPAGTRVNPDDRITFGGQVYKAISCQPGYWIDGRETHVEVLVR